MKIAKIKIFNSFPKKIENPNNNNESFLLLLKRSMAVVIKITDGISPNE